LVATVLRFTKYVGTKLFIFYASHSGGLLHSCGNRKKLIFLLVKASPEGRTYMQISHKLVSYEKKEHVHWSGIGSKCSEEDNSGGCALPSSGIPGFVAM
jgi:hypothetical protein